MSKPAAGSKASGSSTGKILSQEEQQIGYWIELGVQRLKAKIGEEHLPKVYLGLLIVGTLFVLYFFYLLWRLLRDPVKQRRTATEGKHQSKTSSAAAKKGKATSAGGQKEVGAAEESSSDAEGPKKSAAAAGADTPVSKPPSDEDVVQRSRPLNVVAAASTLKGFHATHGGASPNGRYLVLSCTKNQKLHVYPALYFRPQLGKDLGSKGFFSLDEHLGEKPVCYAIGFSDDGASFVVGESQKDTFYCFAVSESGKQATLSWSLKLPNRRLVSVYDRISLDPTGAAVLGFHKKNCEVEVNHRYQGSIGIERFKIGDAMSWSNGSGYLVASGSYIHDVRVGKLSIRPDASSIALDRVFAIRSQPKVLATAITTPGAPASSAASLIITYDDLGVCRIHNLTDVRASNGEEPTCVGTFTDTEFVSKPGAAGSQIRGIAYTFTGEPHHEVLHLAFWNHADVAYYKQSNKGFKGTMTMTLVKDIHNAHDGERIRDVSFIHQGTGLLTIPALTGLSPRLWAL